MAHSYLEFKFCFLDTYKMVVDDSQRQLHSPLIRRAKRLAAIIMLPTAVATMRRDQSICWAAWAKLTTNKE
jgi:hypothetical protein